MPESAPTVLHPCPRNCPLCLQCDVCGFGEGPNLPKILRQAAEKLAMSFQDTVNHWYQRLGNPVIQGLPCDLAMSLGVMDSETGGFFDGIKWFYRFSTGTERHQTGWRGPFDESLDAMLDALKPGG